MRTCRCPNADRQQKGPGHDQPSPAPTRVGVKQGRAGIVLGAVAIALGILGIVIVNDAFEDLDEGISCLDEADTAAEIEACGDE